MLKRFDGRRTFGLAPQTLIYNPQEVDLQHRGRRWPGGEGFQLHLLCEQFPSGKKTNANDMDGYQECRLKMFSPRITWDLK